MHRDVTRQMPDREPCGKSDNWRDPAKDREPRHQSNRSASDAGKDISARQRPTAIFYVQSEEGMAFSVHLNVHDGVGLYREASSVEAKLSLDGATLREG
jgi:hypothetical protein